MVDFGKFLIIVFDILSLLEAFRFERLLIILATVHRVVKILDAILNFGKEISVVWRKVVSELIGECFGFFGRSLIYS